MSFRIEGIDYLRAIMSIFVVVWHMGGGGQSLIFSEKKYLEHVFTVSDFINFHLLLLAVPTFIFVSIYLYASKPVSISAFKKRFSRILLLLCFWPIAFIIIYRASHGGFFFIPSSPAEVIYIVLSAGYTIYYFFTSLLICLIVSHLFLQLNRNLQLSIWLICIILLSLLPQITKITGFYVLSAYWNPFNFIPLSFTAALLAQNKHSIMKNRKIYLLLSVALSVLFSLIEWRYFVDKIFFPGQGYAIPAYTRSSLLFAVFALFIFALDPRIKSNRLIKYMAKYSLALYCLHPFLILPVKNFVYVLMANKTLGLYVSIVLVVVFSYCMAMILRRYVLKEDLVM